MSFRRRRNPVLDADHSDRQLRRALAETRILRSAQNDKGLLRMTKGAVGVLVILRRRGIQPSPPVIPDCSSTAHACAMIARRSIRFCNNASVPTLAPRGWPRDS